MKLIVKVADTDAQKNFSLDLYLWFSSKNKVKKH